MQSRRFNRKILLGVLVLLVGLAAVSVRPVKGLVCMQNAKQAAASGRSLDAAAAYACAAGALPRQTGLWEQAGVQAQAGGDSAQALVYLQQAAQQAPLSAPGWLAFGDATQANGDMAGAVQGWQQAAAADPALLEPHLRLLEQARSQDDYAASETQLKALVSAQPNNAAYNYQLGLLLLATRPEASLAYLEQARSLDPALSDAVVGVQRSLRTALFQEEPAYTFLGAGRALANLGEWDLAAQAFRQAISARSDYAEAWAFLGEAYQHTSAAGDAEKALPALQKSLSLDPHSLAALSLLALYAQRQQQPEQAIIYLQTAAELEPLNPAWQAELGRNTALLGDLQGALAYYNQAVSLAPKDPVYWQALAAFALENQIQIEDVALPAIRQAIELDFEDPRSIDLMGYALFLTEDYSGAERFLLRAIALEPGSTQAHLHLGMLYLMRGQPEAQAELQLAASLEPNSPSAVTAQRLLKRYFP